MTIKLFHVYARLPPAALLCLHVTQTSLYSNFTSAWGVLYCSFRAADLLLDSPSFFLKKSVLPSSLNIFNDTEFWGERSPGPFLMILQWYSSVSWTTWFLMGHLLSVSSFSVRVLFPRLWLVLLVCSPSRVFAWGHLASGVSDFIVFSNWMTFLASVSSNI